MKRTFNDWHEAVKEAERLIATPLLMEITVTLHTGVSEAVTMEYTIKRGILSKENTV